MDEKVFYSQKYFLFKLSDMLNNSYHMFEEKRLESLQLSLQMCIDTYNEINSTPIGTEKLEKGYKGLLENLAFQMKKHPFCQLEQYKGDFNRICNLIGLNPKENKAKYELFMCLKTLKKKFRTKRISNQYVECLRRQMTYGEIDRLIEAFVSDLLFIGYSLVYLSKWYTDNIRDAGLYQAIDNKNLNIYIERLAKLDGTIKEYEIIIPYQVNSVSQNETVTKLLQKHFEIKTKKEFSHFGKEWKWAEDTYACKIYKAADYYKAIAMGKKEFATDIELFSMWQSVISVVHENRQFGCIVQDKLFRVDIREVDYTKLISYFDEARARQLNIFIELKDNMDNEDVDILERVLHTLHAAKNYNIQNQFLNFWSALEYTIYPFPKDSIIEKARILVSESFTLFYIKDKMNIFWKRLNYAMQKRGMGDEHPECKKFMEFCKETDDFNTRKMVDFLQKPDLYGDVLEDISFHIVLKREMCELIMLVTDPKKIRKILLEYHDSIVHDLDYIYRLRNQLIHSAKSMDDSLEHISLRLYRYVNSIVATILYYKKQNPSTSMVEILNSLHNTYEVYMKQLENLEKSFASEKTKINDEQGYKIVRPRYMFLE